MNAYHKFLIKHRIFCERGNGEHLARATKVIKNEEQRDIVVCDFHAGSYTDIQRKPRTIKEQNAQIKP